MSKLHDCLRIDQAIRQVNGRRYVVLFVALIICGTARLTQVGRTAALSINNNGKPKIEQRKKDDADRATKEQITKPQLQTQEIDEENLNLNERKKLRKNIDEATGELRDDVVLPEFQLEKTNLEESTAPKNNIKYELTWSDIELVSLAGSGAISVGFKARIKGREGVYIAKITGDHYLHWSDTEIDMFEILNVPPTIPNIPKLELAVRTMPNPFHNRTYLEETLGVDNEEDKLDNLLAYKDISVMVMEYLDDNRKPSSVPDFRIFLRSLLSTLSFAHSRNVMMCDLHRFNIYFDGTMVKLFDWNAGFIYKPNSVKLHYSQEPHHLMPPEAWGNESAVHATVSGFDIYTVGLLLKSYLKRMDEKTFQALGDVPYGLLVHFIQAAMTEDPYKRPDANKLLHHMFLNETASYYQRRTLR